MRRVAASAVGSNEDFFSVPTSGLVVKYLLGFLGHEKHEATLAEMMGLMQQTTRQLLALSAHEKQAEDGGPETVLMRKIVAPLLKTGSRCVHGWSDSSGAEAKIFDAGATSTQRGGQATAPRLHAEQAPVCHFY